MKRRNRTAHARIWSILAVILPLLLLYALVARQTVPLDRPAVQISESDEGGS